MNTDTKQLPDINENGRDGNGNAISLNNRLYMQLLVFGNCNNTDILIKALEKLDFESVLYTNISNHRSVGLLVFDENPDFFVTKIRQLISQPPFLSLALMPLSTLFGRTYSLGHEQNLKDWLLEKPRRTVLNKEWPWAVWYPLRRKGTFMQLSRDEQKDILKEHGRIGHLFGNADYAHDVRLACHGLDRQDNDFVIGLTGRDLYPISALIETMRSTRQTSEFIENIGPFFIGKAIWQSTMQ